MRQINSVIITIGDELLIGQVIDTNSAFLAQELNNLGIRVILRMAVGDDKKSIMDAIKKGEDIADIIIMTGGLGPTSDDITKPVLCEYFNASLITHVPTLERIRYFFEEMLKKPMIDPNIDQAKVPNNCLVLENEYGTAPGMFFEKNNKLYFSLPGVPYEMKGIFKDKVASVLQKKFPAAPVIHKNLLVTGIGESFLAQELISFEEQIPENIELAYLPDAGMIRLRLSAYQYTSPKELEEQFEKLKKAVANYLVSDKEENLWQYIGSLMKEKGLTLSTAESCTGGYIASLLVKQSGASAYFKGGVIAYSDSVKENSLGVENEILSQYGAVSKQTVEKMAENVRRKISSDIGLAVSGIMGPEGGSPEKPVGTLWIAVSDVQKTTSNSYSLRYDRSRNIEQTAILALNLLRIHICG